MHETYLKWIPNYFIAADAHKLDVVVVHHQCCIEAICRTFHFIHRDDDLCNSFSLDLFTRHGYIRLTSDRVQQRTALFGRMFLPLIFIFYWLEHSYGKGSNWRKKKSITQTCALCIIHRKMDIFSFLNIERKTSEIDVKERGASLSPLHERITVVGKKKEK